jgi:glycosyltransferase involved in cell wall biosynthesis
MNSGVTISAIITCYNSEKTIKVCLESILTQTETVNEVIVVDDGSTDESVNIIRDFFKNSSKQIKFILSEQKNQGPSAARNNGVLLATSSHIAFLDSDDQWFSDHIRISKEFLDNNSEYKITATKYLAIPNNFSGEVSFKKLLIRNYLSTPCVVLDRDCFWANGGFNEKMKYSEDYYLWLSIVFKNRFYKLDYVGAKNIDFKRPFGDKGLSSNLLQMHYGVLKCYDNLYFNKMIDFKTYSKIKAIEKVKHLRRLILTYLHKYKK